jgi:hypothetical protein
VQRLVQQIVCRAGDAGGHIFDIRRGRQARLDPRRFGLYQQGQRPRQRHPGFGLVGLGVGGAAQNLGRSPEILHGQEYFAGRRENRRLLAGQPQGGLGGGHRLSRFSLPGQHARDGRRV